MIAITSVWRVALACAACAIIAGCDGASDDVTSFSNGLADAGHARADADVNDDVNDDANGNLGVDTDGGVTDDANADPDGSTNPAPDADSGPPPTLDSDGDGTADSLDCAPVDPLRWQLLAYLYRDADGDGITVASSGTVCSGSELPATYSNDFTGDDCDDANASVWQLAILYADTDGDGVGAGDAATLCIGQSLFGYAPSGNDCAPDDPNAWALLDYAYRDADDDGFSVALNGQVCAATVLPAGYSEGSSGNDCDDTNPQIYAQVTYYADTDGDSVGAGPASQSCTDGTIPAGSSAYDTDCAPSDETRWQMLTYAFIDRDGDGVTAPSSGSLCEGTSLSPPYYATAHGNDCDDTNPKLTQWDIFWPDHDGDGIGAGAYVFQCDGPGAPPPAGYSRYGDDENDQDGNVGPMAAEDLVDLIVR